MRDVNLKRLIPERETDFYLPTQPIRRRPTGAILRLFKG
jgi:hypothetical protein